MQSVILQRQREEKQRLAFAVEVRGPQRQLAVMRAVQ
jgi:hypothetical protein